jgi:hypothetical protein
MPRPSSRFRRILATLGVVALGAVTGSMSLGVPAAAHTVRVSSSPADGASLTTAPTEVRLGFNQRPMTTPDVAVSLSGQVVPSGPTRVEDATVVTPVTLPGPGKYTVAYRVVSADGHPVEGAVTFTVSGGKTASPAPSAAASASPSLAAASKGPVPPPADTSRWPHLVIALVVLVLAGIGIVLATGPRRPKKRF